MSLLTGREALLMSEPDDDMLSRLDQECRNKNENKTQPVTEISSPLRKVQINGNELGGSPIANLEDKLSPFRASIHEMIQSEATFQKNDL